MAKQPPKAPPKKMAGNDVFHEELLGDDTINRVDLSTLMPPKKKG